MYTWENELTIHIERSRPFLGQLSKVGSCDSDSDSVDEASHYCTLCPVCWARGCFCRSGESKSALVGFEPTPFGKIPSVLTTIPRGQWCDRYTTSSCQAHLLEKYEEKTEGELRSAMNDTAMNEALNLVVAQHSSGHHHQS